MTDTRTFILRDSAIRERCATFIRSLDGVYQVTVKLFESKRTLEQNAALWALLTEISEQVEWYGQFYEPEAWKDILTAGLKKQRFAPGIEGGLVVLGARTSKMSVREMSELLEFAKWFAVEKGVRFSAREAA